MSLTTAPPALAAVAQRYSASARGIVGFVLHRVLDVRAGFSKRHEDLLIRGIYANGTVVEVRVVSYTIDGRPASASDVATMTQAYEHPVAGAAFASPFDARYFGAYSYRLQGPRTIAFSSTVNDAGHGNGSFVYDARGNVVGDEYQPNVLPPHAKWGEIEERRAEVLPSYWAVVVQMQHYTGSYGPFPGTATEQVDFSGFRRYGDLRSAIRSL